MNRVLRRVSTIAFDLVTLAEAKAHLRFEEADEDTLISALILSAVDSLSWLGRSLSVTQWELDLDGFATEIPLPRPPLVSLASITYRDQSGATQTLSASIYEVVAPEGGPAFVRRKPGQQWPQTDAYPASVTLAFSAGYGSANPLPASLRAAILLLVGDLFENRGGKTVTNLQTNPTVAALLDPLRVWL